MVQQLAAIIAQRQVFIPPDLEQPFVLDDKGIPGCGAVIFPAEDRDEVTQYSEIFAFLVV